MTLRVAVPNKGALSQAASEILREAGYRQRSDSKELALIDADNDVEFFYLRPRDIALYVGEGTLDVGITGRDLLLDSGAKAEEAMALGFGRSKFHFAGPAGRYAALEDLSGLRIATSYVGVVEDFLFRRGIEASVTRLDGAVETSINPHCGLPGWRPSARASWSPRLWSSLAVASERLPWRSFNAGSKASRSPEAS